MHLLTKYLYNNDDDRTCQNLHKITSKLKKLASKIIWVNTIRYQILMNLI